jgi:IclR family transcriptional regulator, KDG regulon repressor
MAGQMADESSRNTEKNTVDKKTIESVNRALNILELFDEHNAELGITEMAKLTGLHKSTLAGLVYTLESSGWLAQNQDTRKYRLGSRLIERAGVALRQLEAPRIARPYLAKLVETHNESVNLGILEGTTVLYVEHISSPQPLSIRVEIGKRGYIHSTALGKAILSAISPLEARELMQRIQYVTMTPHTIATADQLSAEIDLTRQRGFSVDDQENELGGRCVGAPIFSWAAKCVGAVSISAPVQRFTRDKIEYYGDIVKAAAQSISRALGYTRGE